MPRANAHVPPTARGRTVCAVFAAVRLAAGCASSDLGTPCHLLRADNSEQAPRPGHDVMQSGSGECEAFVCLSSAGRSPVCSRGCDRAGDACENGLVCRAIVLDPPTLDAMRQRLQGRDDNRNGIDDFQEIASGLVDSLYCAPH